MLKAPKIDFLLNVLSNTDKSAKIFSEDLYNLINEIYAIIKAVKPQIDYNDIIREIYVNANIGSIKDFGDYNEYKEEELVENYNDFLQLRKDTYPERVKWYKISFIEYSKKIYISIDSKIQFNIGINSENNEVAGFSTADKYSKQLLDWLYFAIKKEVSDLKKNQQVYNKNLQKKISCRKLIGKIRRIKLWENISGIERLDKLLGNDIISDLESYIENNDENQLISEMTASDFYRYCEICYDANDYFKNAEKELTPKEKYLRMADGRDEGLRDINENSNKAFTDWLNNKFGGGHPWEICRGGNSTHISLYVNKQEKGFQLRLAGSSKVRVAETVRMAVALYKKNIPFLLSQSNEILRMIKGNDYIGIVPENVFPRYCHGMFPKEDNIIDFLNPCDDKEVYEYLVKNAAWYKLKPIELDE